MDEQATYAEWDAWTPSKAKPQEDLGASEVQESAKLGATL